MHQRTRQSITRRYPAILNLLKRYNANCKRLSDILGPSTKFPLPLPLPTTLDKLRDDENLYQDVWISPNEEQIAPRWLVEPQVKQAIKALVQLDRTVEERRRLQREAKNMFEWFARKVSIIEIAVRCEHGML